MLQERLLSLEGSWELGENPDDCKSKHHGHFNKEQVRISRSALPQILGRLWSKDRKMMWSSQHGLRKCKSCLTSLIAFCDGVFLQHRGGQWILYTMTLTRPLTQSFTRLVRDGLDKWAIKWAEIDWTAGFKGSFLLMQSPAGGH